MELKKKKIYIRYTTGVDLNPIKLPFIDGMRQTGFSHGQLINSETRVRQRYQFVKIALSVVSP